MRTIQYEAAPPFWMLESIRKDYDEAMRDASERISKLQDVAVRSGYAKEDLKTTSFNVDTRYESVKDRQGNYKREFAGYACVYRLKLAFDFDSKQLAEVISCISNCGTNPELSIAFTVRNPAKVSAELLESAALNARAKAEILCRASGCEMGQLILENVVYLELIRRGYEVFVGAIDDGEVDFVAKTDDGQYLYYQVAASTLDPNTLKRELAPFKRIADNYPKTLLTLDEVFSTADYEGIQKRNVLDWLLDE